MIVINYIKPYIVISADYLMTGVIHIYNDRQIIKRIKIHNESTISIKNNWQTCKTLKIEMVTQKENSHKIINL